MNDSWLFEKPSSDIVGYQPIFDALDVFLREHRELLRGYVATPRGQREAQSVVLSKIGIIRCSPTEITLSAKIFDGRQYVTIFTLNATSDGTYAGFYSQCSCSSSPRCGHLVSLIKALANSNWAENINNFMNGTPSDSHARKDVANLNAVLGSSKVALTDDSFRSLPDNMSRRLDNLVSTKRLSESGSASSTYQLAYALSIGLNRSRCGTFDWEVVPLVLEQHQGHERIQGLMSLQQAVDSGRLTLTAEDSEFLVGFGQLVSAGTVSRYGPSTVAPGPSNSDLLLKVIAADRCLLSSTRGKLSLGLDISVKLGWRKGNSGSRNAVIVDGLPAGLQLLQATPDLLYLNLTTYQIGRVTAPDFEGAISDWLLLPRFKAEQSASLVLHLRQKGLPIAGLEDVELPCDEVITCQPKVKVSVFASEIDQTYLSWPVDQDSSANNVAVVRLEESERKVYLIRQVFQYGDCEVKYVDPRTVLPDPSKPTRKLQRDLRFEREAIKKLVDVGGCVCEQALWYSNHKEDGLYTVRSHSFNHERLVLNVVRQLMRLAESDGWEVDAPLELMPYAINSDDIEGELVDQEEEGSEWFEAKLHVEAHGQPFDLGDLLVSLLKKAPSQIGDITHSRATDVVVMLRDRSISFERKRLHRLLSVMRELSDPENRDVLRFNRFSAYALENALNESCGRWQSSEQIKILRERIARLEKPTSVSEPLGFAGSLRDYQQHGLAWLSTLVQAELGGVLADDMGLGKTVQLIALIVLERRAGRNGVNLVVCPKSVVPNWAAELARFAPELKVHQATGANRCKDVSVLAAADVVVTSYALLQRDADILQSIQFNLALFDEAQAIKNPLTASYVSALAIKARLKIPVSGTPLENNLQDLWAHFNLTMPGFLYSHKTFNQVYRKPIEKEGDVRLRNHLAERIKPFVLRRTKVDVVKDLPPLTEITHTCQIEGDQLDLYETIRQLTTKKVREALRSKGAKRSHIEFLDALLKLRQVCCDPRLVKTATARQVKRSGKLEVLMELVPKLLSEGRSVVVFSQFTSMLGLIEQEVQKRSISYSMLTGETTDREGAIKAFQSGKSKLFLMSLKAGGVGINLTSADTIILYDPWWNPAVEAQAICRAHRIGQQNPVFAYRLIAQGTIEEKILDLQIRKRALVENILTENERPPELSQELVDYLFAPVGEEGAQHG